MIISFETFKAQCRHHGWIKDGKMMCDYKGMKKAACWDDWQLCCSGNCPFNRKNEAPEKYEQYIFDLEEEI